MIIRTLTKKFRFESAHRLSKGYCGKCSNIHGHSWNGELVLRYEQLVEYDMGVDFAIMKQIIKPVEDALDHALILWCGDTELIAFCKEQNYKLVILDKNPTSEALVEWLYEEFRIRIVELADNLPDTVGIYSITLEETCTSRCEVKFH